MNDQELRAAFEAWVSAPPFERQIGRYPEKGLCSALAGIYHDLEVNLAWEAWKEATERAEASRAVDRHMENIQAEARMLDSIERSLTTPPSPDNAPDFVFAVRRRLEESGQPWVDMREHYWRSAERRDAAEQRCAPQPCIVCEGHGVTRIPRPSAPNGISYRQCERCHGKGVYP
jgi:hypothetical protein